MYKLLPEENRAQVARAYAGRRAVVALIALNFAIIVGMVGLFPSYVLSDARRQEVAERTRLIGEMDSNADQGELQTWLSSINSKLKLLSPLHDTDRPSLFIDQVLSERSDGIRFTRVIWSKDESKAKVLISGIGRDRQSLVAFEKKLNDSGRFGRVALPLSNLAKDKDIGFNVSLSLKQP